MQIEAHTPLTTEGYNKYEQLEAAAAAATLRNGNIPDPQIGINEEPGAVWMKDNDDGHEIEDNQNDIEQSRA